MSSLDWFQFVISIGLQASLLTAVACTIERRCHAANVKSRIWSCYYLSLLAVLVVGLATPRLRLGNPWRNLSADSLLSIIRVERTLSWMLLGIWMIGSCGMLSRWMVNARRLQRFLLSCRLIGSVEMARLQLLTSAELLRLHGRDVQFRVGPEELGPSCYQLHRPVIILPPSLLHGDESELRYVLQHELEHLRTQHPLQVFGQRTAQSALWFLPMVWRAGRRASLAREFVCDDAATSRGASTANYLRTLLRFAQQQPKGDCAMLGIARSTSELRLRAQRIANPRCSTSSQAAWLAPLTMVLIASAASQLWLPTNPLASAKTYYSPWPTWSAAALHTFDVSARDFDQFDSHLQVHELLKERTDAPTPEH